jgi:sugar phosphate isomerase/epimerase
MNDTMTGTTTLFGWCGPLSRYDYDTFFRNLKRAGYPGLMSCECGIHGDPVDGMRLSADYLRQKWRETPDQ